MTTQRQATDVGPWDGVTKLVISFEDDSDPSSGKVFRNGLHQIGVKVVVLPVDTDGTHLTEQNTPGIRNQVLSKLKLINSSGLAALPFVETLSGIGECGASAWCYTAQRNQFNVGGPSGASVAAVQGNSDDDSDLLQFIFYVMCPPAEKRDGISILAQVAAPSGTVDTSGGGNSPSASNVHVAALQPVRYTDSNTLLKNTVAYRAPENGSSLTKLARNYWFSCNEPQFHFVLFRFGDNFAGRQYFHVYDEDATYHNGNESFDRYRKFRLAYAWRADDAASQQVFGLRPSQGAQPEQWPVQINQTPGAQYFTVAEYDSTIGDSTGFGYPGSPVNDTTPAIGGTSLFFTVWDQYGNSSDFHPTTDDLLDEFKVLPGRD